MKVFPSFQQVLLDNTQRKEGKAMSVENKDINPLKIADIMNTIDPFK